MPVAVSQDELGGGGDLQPWSRTGWWCVTRDSLCPCGQHFGVAESETFCDIPR